MPIIFTDTVQAGFPSPAQDHIEDDLSLDQYLISSPDSTFFIRVAGTSMLEEGILEGDIVVVDRALRPRHGDSVIAAVEGEFTLKKLHLKSTIKLLPANPDFPAIELTPTCNNYIWGVVSAVVRKLR